MNAPLLPSLAMAALLVLSAATTTTTAAKPNIVLIVADDQGHAQVGYHNASTLTPRIDALAGEGVKLENYYVQPVCSPTRSTLMTGRYV
jgi:arylsulfatase B/arylsulfatase I/J